MSEEQWMRLKTTMSNHLHLVADGSLLLLCGIVVMFIVLGWSHILFLAWFSSQRILYTGLWILFSVVVLGWIAREV